MTAPRFCHQHGASLAEGALVHSTRLRKIAEAELAAWHLPIAGPHGEAAPEKTSLAEGALVHCTGLRKLAEVERAAWHLPITGPHDEAAPEEPSSA